MAIADGTFAGLDLDIAQTARFQALLDDSPIMSMYTDDSYSMDMRTKGFAEVDVLLLDKDGTAASTIPVTARKLAKYKDDFAAAKEFNVAQITFRGDQGGENSFKMYTYQIERSGQRGAARIDAATRQMQVNALNAIEDNLIAYLGDLEVYTTDAPVAADLPTTDNDGENNNAGKIHQLADIGNNTNGVLATGLPAGTFGADFFAGCTRLMNRLIRRNVIGGQVVAGELSGGVAFVQPEIISAVRHYLRTQKIPMDTANINLYENFRAFSMSPTRDTFSGINFIGSTQLPLPAAFGTDNFNGYFLTRNAIAMGIQAQNFWSESPPYMNDGAPDTAGDFYEYHQIFRYGRQLINAEQCIKLEFGSVSA